MPVQEVSNANYSTLKQSNMFVLAVTSRYCDICQEYKSVLETTSLTRPDVNFGVAELEKGRLGDLKREYPHPSFDDVPRTIIMREGKDVGGFLGAASHEELLTTLKHAENVGKTIYSEWEYDGKTGQESAFIKEVIDSDYIIILTGDGSETEAGKEVRADGRAIDELLEDMLKD